MQTYQMASPRSEDGRLLLRRLGGGPIQNHADLRRIVALHASHHQSLAVRRNIIAGHGGAAIEFAVEQLYSLFSTERRSKLHRDAHYFRAVAIENLAPGTHPAGFFSPFTRDLPSASRTGHRFDVDLRTSRIVRSIGNPLTVGGETSLALHGRSVFKRTHVIRTAQA